MNTVLHYQAEQAPKSDWCWKERTVGAQSLQGLISWQQHEPTLQAVAGLCLLAHHIQHRVDQLSTLGVVTLGPVVTSTSLAKDKVVWPEDLAVGAGPHRVHGAGLQVHEDGTGHIATCGCAQHKQSVKAEAEGGALSCKRCEQCNGRPQGHYLHAAKQPAATIRTLNMM